MNATTSLARIALAAMASATSWLFLVVVATGAGCDITTNDDDDDGLTRSAKCLKYEDALCTFEFKCNLVTSRDDCDNRVRATFCQEDAVVESCLDALPSAACTGVPAPCLSVPNTKPAIDGCNGIVSLYCQKQEACSIESQSECVANAPASINCSAAVGITSGIDACRTAITNLACEAAVALPEACSNVVQFAP